MTLTPEQSSSELKTMARLAGGLYLLIFFAAGFAQAGVREALIVAGDAAATAANIQASEGLFRIGIAADVVAFMADAVVAVLLFFLLRSAGTVLAAVAAAFRLIAHPAMASINLSNQWSVLSVLENGGSAEQVYLLMQTHNFGYLLAGFFFGVSLILLGQLIWRSAHFPNWLGVLVAIAGTGYLIESFGMVLAPGAESLYTMIVTITAVVGEFALTGWLLAKGVRTES